ncbi:MAG: O-antigen ligase family protein [Chloroflexi bacterium]|nr:O-antigen ligase family protein [Chloroflexota bacterium]
MNRIYISFQWVTAGLLAFLLPFTSFPLVARLTGSSMVAPLSIIPLLLLLVFWFVPYCLRGGTLPGQVRWLIGFIIAAFAAGAAAFFLPFPPYKGVTLLRSEVEAFASLAVGVCFYLVVAGWTGQRERLCFFLRWINWSGVLLIGWAFFQAGAWYLLKGYPEWMWDFQGRVSTSLLLYAGRSNGFAYEPSWLAHQLNMLYLPLWLSATVTGFTAHNFRLGKLHFEHFLLAAGSAVLVLSISRIGWLTFVVMVAYLLLRLNIYMVRWARNRFFQNYSSEDRWVRLFRRGFVPLSILVLLLVYTGLIIGAGYGLTKVDPRMARLFDFSAIKEAGFIQYANQLVFAERIVFWQAGWEVFNDFPFLGVGLGNAGYFFPQKLSAFSWALTEVRTLLFQWSSLPNIKNLWVRLLAETGIIGFAMFICWVYILWKSSRYLSAHGDRLMKMIGLAGELLIAGFIIEGFSLDTFALPYYWILFGLLSAACGLPGFVQKGGAAAAARGTLH